MLWRIDVAEYPFDFFYLRISGNTRNAKFLEKRVNSVTAFAPYNLQINGFNRRLHLRSLFFYFLLCGNNRNTKLQGSLQAKNQSFQHVYFILKSKNNPESRVYNLYKFFDQIFFISWLFDVVYLGIDKFSFIYILTRLSELTTDN
jgi:hypothetical protein